MDVLSDQFYSERAKELKDRVSEKRLAHIEGVAKCAAMLAQVYGIDERKARLAGLLHDWDKGYRNNAMRERVCDLGLDSSLDPWVVANLPEVLHGPTAAAALSRSFPEIPPDVIHAIWVHTVACKDMSDLDKIIYVADAIEPNRNYDGVDAIRAEVGKVQLDDLYRDVYKHWLSVLLEKEVVMHPDTIDIWNEMVYDGSRKKKKKFD